MSIRSESYHGENGESQQQPRRFHRDRVMLSLPNDFLRLESDLENIGGPERQINVDQEAAIALQQQYTNYNGFTDNIKGKLVITVVEAKLVKNYGVTRMDPYVRLRLGHAIYETRTCYNGAKNPRWNRIFQCSLPNGVDTIHVELYDECAFTMDEKIAWAEYKIPSQIFNGETVEHWIPLDGKQGDGKEGTICMILSFAPISRLMITQQPRIAFVNYNQPQQGQIIGQPVHPQHHPHQQLQQQQQLSNQVMITEDEVDQICEMFPNVDREVIRNILEDQNGNKERTINALIQVNSD
ncbi:toll-interacting protein B-like [Panonychus citri]|uniref:toll-interacting protein B-like n=1 Tax=Panonychus citri TaxID=50023 RepID=UPI0023080874|nr:toll-interacting protein B-like [Panonychus citri]